MPANTFGRESTPPAPCPRSYCQGSVLVMIPRCEFTNLTARLQNSGWSRTDTGSLARRAAKQQGACSNLWLYVPSASARESAGSTSPSISVPNSSALDLLSRSASSSGKLQPSTSWLRAWKTGAFPLLRSGLTLSPSTAARFADEWISSLPDSLVSPTQSLGNNSATRTSEHSGQNLSEWWERCSQHWFSSRTSLPLFGISGQSDASYNEWATALRSRCLSRRRNAARRTSGNGSSSWPTTNTRDSSGAARHTTRSGGRMHPGTTFTDAILAWPSPRSEDAESCGNHPNAMDSLGGVSRIWSTPISTEVRQGFRDRSRGKKGGQISLSTETMLWRTPDAPGGAGHGTEKTRSERDTRSRSESKPRCGRLPTFPWGGER